MTTYKDVQDILDTAVSHKKIGGHGAFWRDVDRDGFVKMMVSGKVPLLATKADGSFDVENSNLVNALQGTKNFGADIGNTAAKYDRMPKDMKPVPPEKIEAIKAWLENGAPA